MLLVVPKVDVHISTIPIGKRCDRSIAVIQTRKHGRMLLTSRLILHVQANPIKLEREELYGLSMHAYHPSLAPFQPLLMHHWHDPMCAFVVSNNPKSITKKLLLDRL